MIDFVAYVARKVLLGNSQNSSSSARDLKVNSTTISADDVGTEAFRFILYASFESESESIGL